VILLVHAFVFACSILPLMWPFHFEQIGYLNGYRELSARNKTDYYIYSIYL
jgi:hypothetical protein